MLVGSSSKSYMLQLQSCEKTGLKDQLSSFQNPWRLMISWGIILPNLLGTIIVQERGIPQKKTYPLEWNDRGILKLNSLWNLFPGLGWPCQFSDHDRWLLSACVTDSERTSGRWSGNVHGNDPSDAMVKTWVASCWQYKTHQNQEKSSQF